MENEVIIDGVNVAECNSFLNEYEFPNNLKGGYYKEKNLCECGVQGAESYPFFCKDNPECYYKQLQRAKAENERLKEEIKIQDNLAEHFRKEALYWAKKAEEYIKEAENEEK